jgi:hypothetical protein
MKVSKKVGTLKKVQEEKEELKSLSLPTEVSSPASHIGEYSILLYGEKKIGKTSLASKFDKAIFLMFEPGGKALQVYQRPVHSWEEFKKYNSLLQKDTHFRTVVLDTVDIAYQLNVSYVCKKLVIDHLSEEAWGKGWQAARDEFNEEITKLLHSGKGVIFISHAAEKEIKTRVGDTYHKISPTMAGQARDILEGLVDIWMYYGYDRQSRVMYIEGDDHIGAGHRLETRFKYVDGVPIKEISAGKNPTEAYANFIKAFNNQLQKGGTVSVKKGLVLKKTV